MIYVSAVECSIRLHTVHGSVGRTGPFGPLNFLAGTLSYNDLTQMAGCDVEMCDVLSQTCSVAHLIISSSQKYMQRQA